MVATLDGPRLRPAVRTIAPRAARSDLVDLPRKTGAKPETVRALGAANAGEHRADDARRRPHRPGREHDAYRVGRARATWSLPWFPRERC
jgi:hypothetical protein